MKITERCNCGESIEYDVNDVHEDGLRGWRALHFDACDVDQGVAVVLDEIRGELVEMRNLLREILGALSRQP